MLIAGKSRGLREGWFMIAVLFMSSIYFLSLHALSHVELPRPVVHMADPFVKPEPSYAKWGRLAVAEVKRKYPACSVIDYLHLGRQELSAQTAKESFRLWLRKDTREWGVRVDIVFNKQTEKPISIRVQDLR